MRCLEPKSMTATAYDDIELAGMTPAGREALRQMDEARRLVRFGPARTAMHASCLAHIKNWPMVRHSRLTGSGAG